MKPAKQKAPMTQNPLCNEETPPPPPQPPPLPAPPPQASLLQRFSALVAKYTLRDGIESDDNCFAGKEEDESDTNILS